MIVTPLLEQEVGYRPGHLGIPVLHLPLALPMGLSAGKAVQQKVGSRVELKAFEKRVVR
ncbi:MAG TPA: hypothetical protein VFN35_04555 [Ktedonobacteraceae bacterium]|nr:hypothetical protein [Ktedonobacteraceae bacterium]